MSNDLLGSGPLVRGGAVTLDSICAAHFRPLAGALRLYLGEPLVADELAQEALLRLCMVWERGERIENPGAWLHRTGFNLAKSWLRRRVAERRATARLEALSHTEDMSPPDPAGSLALSAALRALPRRQRQALVLRYYADLDVATAAEVMGCAPGTVKALTHKALLALRSKSGLTIKEDSDGI